MLNIADHIVTDQLIPSAGWPAVIHKCLVVIFCFKEGAFEDITVNFTRNAVFPYVLVVVNSLFQVKVGVVFLFSSVKI